MTAHLFLSSYKSPGQDSLKLELCFVGQDCPRVPLILGTTYGGQTRRLDLSYNSISSLDGLDRFPQLEELILDNNRLSDDVRWPLMPHLTTLSINKNQFCNSSLLLVELQQSCPQLRYLSLLNNPACPDQLSVACTLQDYRNYRLAVLQHLPKLRFMDSRRVSNKERREAKDNRTMRQRINMSWSRLLTDHDQATRATTKRNNNSIDKKSTAPRKTSAAAIKTNSATDKQKHQQQCNLNEREDNASLFYFTYIA